MSKKKILLIEDTPETIDIIRKVLNNNNYDVFISTDGELSIEKAEMNTPDLILLDILMPKIDGYETCKRLKDNPKTKDIPVIFMSALADAFDKVKAFKLGAVDYITKPLNVEELLVRISTHLTIRQLQADLEATNNQLEQTIQQRTRALATTSKIMHYNDQKYKFLFNNLLAGIVFTNLENGKFLDLNKRAYSLLGFASKEECIAKFHFSKNYVNPEQREVLLEKIKKEGKIENIELQIYKKDKTKIWVELSSYHNKDNSWLETVFVDITHRKK